MFATDFQLIVHRLFRVAALSALILACLSSMKSFGQVPVQAVPEFEKVVSFSDVLTGLADKSVSSYFDRNRQLIKAIDDRGMGFAFNATVRESLKKADASEALLWSVERGQKKRTDEIGRLYGFLTSDEVRKNDIETKRKRIIASKELLDRLGDPEMLTGDESEFRPVIKWLKESLPKLEESLNRRLKIKPDHE